MQLKVGVFRQGRLLFWLINRPMSNKESAFWVYFLDTLDLPLETGDYIAADKTASN